MIKTFKQNNGKIYNAHVKNTISHIYTRCYTFHQTSHCGVNVTVFCTAATTGGPCK